MSDAGPHVQDRRKLVHDLWQQAIEAAGGTRLDPNPDPDDVWVGFKVLLAQHRAAGAKATRTEADPSPQP